MKLFLDKFSIEPKKALMAEDMAINLEPAYFFGVKTLWIKTKYIWGEEKNVDYIDFKTDNLQAWLKDLLKKKFDI